MRISDWSSDVCSSDLCDTWAKAGYAAYAPDLFWRVEPGVELNPDVPQEFDQALELMGRFNQDQGVRDIEAVIHAIHRSQGPDTKVRCVGYCLGGRLAFMTATRTDISASVGYSGVGIANLLSEIGRASCRERGCQYV